MVRINVTNHRCKSLSEVHRTGSEFPALVSETLRLIRTRVDSLPECQSQDTGKNSRCEESSGRKYPPNSNHFCPQISSTHLEQGSDFRKLKPRHLSRLYFPRARSRRCGTTRWRRAWPGRS